jgi:ferric-dicitrate binding protein FerR (iron transport regulator)
MSNTKVPLVVVAVVISTFLSFTSCSGTKAPADTKPQAEAPQAAAPAARSVRPASVVYIEGKVTVNGASVEPGDEIGRKFNVRTEAGARLDLVFDERNVLSIGQNAFVDIDLTSLVPDVKLERGGVTAVLKKLEVVATGNSFNVQTAQTVMGVRGTSFCIWADASSTYVCACNGEIHTVDAKGNNEETLTAAHHLARVYTPKDGGISVAAAGLLHHTDASVESVASRISYTIDWTKVDK